MSSSQTQWYTGINGRQEGPFSLEQILDRTRSGQLTRESLVFARGVTPSWVPLSTIPDFVRVLDDAAATQPPLPPVPATYRKRIAHEVDYKIFGEDLQYVEIELDPMETVVAESGAMMYMSGGIEIETRFGDGSKPDQGFLGKVFEGAKRAITGESLFINHFTQKAGGKGRVAFAAPFPGKILAIDLESVGGRLICQKNSFLCCAKGISIGIAFQKRLGAGFFGGEGFIMQKLEGDGLAFVHAGGYVVERTLAAGERLRVDTGCIVAHESEVDFDIQFVGGVKSALFGGEGLFYATLTGPGRIWLQSLPLSRLADRIIAASPRAGGAGREEGSVLGGLGRLLDGDS